MRRDGWKTLDADERYGTDYVATIPPLPATLLEDTWDEIELTHGIEHFYLWEAEQLLRECYELLDTGGKLVLEQPDILVAAAVLLGLKTPFTSTPGQSDMWPLYGDPTHRNPLYIHRWGWTLATLMNALVVAGFKREHITSTWPQHHLPYRDFRLEATK